VTSAGPYSQSSTVTYTITVTNEGSLNAAGIVVTDRPETGLSLVSMVPQAGVTNNGNGTFSIASLAQGASISFVVNYQIGATFQGTSLNNEAEITTDNGDDVDSTPNNDVPTEDDQDDVTIPVQQTYDLALTKVVTSAGPYSQGSTVTYTITVTNEGSLNAAGIVVTDRPETGLSLVSMVPQAGVTNNGNGTFTIASLAQGASISFVVNYQIGATFQGTSLNNEAEITTDNGDDVDSTPNNDVPTEDDQDDVTIPVQQTYDLALTKVVTSAGPYSQSSTVTYTITVTNEGSLNAAGIVVTDRPEAGLSLVSMVPQAGVTNNGDGTFSIASLAQGASISFVVNYQIGATFQGFSITNEAEITTDDGDDTDSTPNNDVPTEDDQDDVTVPVEQTASVDIEKATNGQDADTFEESVIILVPNVVPTVTWTYTITNTGTLDQINLVVTDDREGAVCTIPFLAAGATTTCTKSAPAIRGIYSNEGTVVAQPIDVNGNPYGNTVTDSDPSNYVGLYINVDKEADKEEICAGETVTFSLTMRMLGGAPGLQFRDIGVNDDNLPMQLVPGGTYWLGGDTNNNGFLDFGEEFVWGYSLVYTQTTTNHATDMATVWFLGNNTGLQPMGMDQWTVTVNPDRCASIGDYVWMDLNGNGLQDDGPTGIDNVTVNLLDGNGNFITSTQTDGTGFYQFTGLIPGSYIVEFDLPTGMVFTNANQGNDDDIDSDANTTTGQSQVVTVVNGQQVTNVDAGMYPPIDINLEKTFVNATLQPNGTYNATYTIAVTNLGGPGQYDLTDTPSFDNDISINSASYTSTVPTNGALAGSGPWTLANDQAIVAFATHTYTLVVNVSMDLLGGGGDNQYTACGEGTAQPQPGQGLYNLAAIDTNNDGQPEATADDCGDLPDLNVTKTFVSATRTAQGVYEVRYNITVSNGGGEGQYDLTDTPGFDDDITPVSGTYTSDAPGNTSGITAGLGPWTLANDQPIAANATHTYVLTVVVNYNLTDNIGDNVYTACGEGTQQPQPGQGLFNHVALDVNNDGTPERTDTDCGDLNLIDLELEKSVDRAFAPIGTQVVFTVTVLNTSQNTATGVVVTDQLPSGYSYVSHTGIGTYNPVNGEWFLGTIFPGSGGVLQITATINATGDYVNYAEVTFANEDDIDSTPDNGVDTNNNGVCADDAGDEDDGDCAEVTPLPTVDLELEKEVSNLTPNVFEPVTFTVTVTNQGPSVATGVTVLDELPNGYTYVGHTASQGTWHPVFAHWNIGTLAVGQTVTLIVEVTVNPTGNYLNQAYVITCNEYDVDSNPGNTPDTNNNGDCTDDQADEDDGDCAGVTPNPPIDIELDKSVSPVTVNAGQTVTFTLDVNNNGPGTATGVVVQDIVPSGYNQVAAISNGGVLNGNIITWTIPSLAAGQSIQLTFQATVLVTGNHLNTGEVIAHNEIDLDSTPGNGPDTNNDGNCIDDMFDEDDADCATVILNPCDLTAVVDSVVCSDNGTGLDPSDDTFTVYATINGTSTSGTWASNAPGNPTGAIGTQGVFGPYAISSYGAGSDVTFLVFDAALSSCQARLNFTVPQPCSDQCVMNVTASAGICDPGADLFNPNDDTYSFYLTINTTNGGSANGWTAFIGGLQVATGNYGFTPVLFAGPYLISNGDVSVTIVDNDDPNCTQTIIITAPAPCPVAGCQLNATYAEVLCDDNGTPTNPNDDTYTFRVVVNRWGTGNTTFGWTANDANSAGAYGVVETFGPYSIAQGDRTIRFTDFLDPNCFTEITVPAPPTCSNQCEVIVSTPQVLCSPNGTLSNPNDDTYTVTFTVTGNNAGTTWTGTASNSGASYPISGSFANPQAITTGAFPISGGNVIITINAPGATQQACVQTTRVVTAPAPCSTECEINAGIVENPQCNDNGTPSNPADDYFSFTVLANGFNLGTNGWRAFYNGVQIGSGSYGVPATISNIAIPGLPSVIQVSIVDASNGNCFTLINVTVPPTCSDQCSISAQELAVLCDQNGTPVNGSDDQFLAIINVTPLNNNSGTVFVNGEEWPYGQITIGPFPISGGNLNLTITDAQNPGCSASLSVTPPAPCPQCEITAQYLNVQCNNNGTPWPEDDTYSFDLLVTGFNTSALGWRQLHPIFGATQVLRTGQYGVIATYTGIPIGTDTTLIIADRGDLACITTLTVSSPSACPYCEIDAVVSEAQCVPNGAGPADDTYTFTVTVSGHSTAGTWTGTAGGQAISGPYNTPVLIGAAGQFLITGGNIPVIINDANDANCSTGLFTVEAPEHCGDPVPCDITVMVDSVLCNNMGTLTLSDDTYAYSLFVDGQGLTGTGWTGSNGTTGIFGQWTRIAGNPMGINAVFTIAANITNGCAAAVFVNSPPPCGNCVLEAQLISNVCNDNGTPLNSNDDTWTVTVRATYDGSGGPGYLIYDGISAVPSFGLYGGPAVTLPVYSNSVQSVTLTFVDVVTGTCTDVLVVNNPCVPAPCQITTNVQNVRCDDNGTPSNSSDDTFSFEFRVTGANTGSGWTATGGISMTGNYGQTYMMTGYPISGGQICFTVVDNNNPNCTSSVCVTPPATCSGQCTLTATASTPICNDNGTPSNPNDDTFTFNLTASGANTGSSWRVVGTALTGNYGQTVNAGTYPISGGEVCLILEDVNNSACRDTVCVTPPATCSDKCVITTATYSNAQCNDNGTPANPNDDTFSVTIFVNGANLGTSWTATGAGFPTTTGSYNQSVTVSGIAIGNGAQRCITIRDNADSDCTFNLCITPPATCSDQCSLTVTTSNATCDDRGTADPSDDVFYFDMSVSGFNTGNSTGWTITNSSVTGSGVYPANMVQVGPFPISGPAPLTVTDNLGNCSADVTVDPPVTVTIDCPDDVNELTFNRNVQLLSGALTSTDAAFTANDTLCWLPSNLQPAGSRRYDLARFKTDANIADGTVYTFVLLSQMALNNAPAPLPNPMVDGAGAIFEGNYDFTNPCCNVLDAADAPHAGLYNPTFNAADLGLTGYTAVQQMSLRLKPGQEYTLLTTTWAPGTLGNYAWAIYSYDAMPLLQVTGNMQPIAGVEAPITYDLICTDMDSIAGNTTYTGEAEVNGTCGFDRVEMTDSTIGGDCQDVIIVRNFTAYGLNGPLDACEQLITIRKATFADVNWPRMSAMYPCESVFLTDANGNPHPSVTGYPFVMTAFGAFDLNSDYCNLSASYVDTRVSACANAYEVRRLWTVRDECNPNEVVTFTQTLKVGDYEGPIVDCPIFTHYCPVVQDSIMMFPTDPFECSATVLVPMPEVTDNCSDNWSVITQIVNAQNEVVYTILPGQNRTITGVQIGDYRFRYIVTDECGNTTIKECPFRVADTQEPVAICQGAINISLGAQGLARLYTTSVNLGSYDNCGIATIELRRIFTRNSDCELMPEADWYWSDWGPYVQFNCCDAGQHVMVEMRVTDIHGNTNVCWLNVLVEDKTVPTCVAPAPVTVACDALPSNFDPYNTTQLTTLFGAPTVHDNCSAFAEEFAPIVNLDSCGFGTIIRRFRAIDRVGNVSPGNFQQVVTINNVTHYAVRFPADVQTDCINNVDTARVYEIGCDRITVTHRDTILPATGSACYVVRRTYDVINHCEWNGISAPVVIGRDEDCDLLAGDEAVWVLRRPDTTYIDRDSMQFNLVPLAGTKGTICDGSTNLNGYWRKATSNGYWQYTQFITVYDTIAPVVAFTQPQPFCTTTAACETSVIYPFTLAENCDFDTARIVILLDASADGTVDADLTNAGVLKGSYPNYRIEGVFPIGRHNFVVTVVDRCGNSSTTNLPFEVVDCYVVDPICYSGLIVNLAPVSPATDLDGDGDLDAAGVQVFANELGLCSLEDCTGPVTLSVNRVGETPNREQTSLWLTCDDRYSVNVEVYVWDSAGNPYSVQPDGTVGGPNFKFCTAMIFVQDPNYLCPNCEEDALVVELAGNILTETGKPVENVTVNLAGASYQTEITNVEGRYRFEEVPMFENYTVTPVKDDDHSNGVTTLDIILIQRHLLGVQPLDSPYKLIAADANNSGAITTLDLIEIRRLVLGEIEQFTSNTSWRFVPRSYVFPVANNPWFEDFPETVVKSNLTACDFAVDFIGVKVGDVNLTSNPNSLSAVEDRSTGAVFGLRLDDMVLSADETQKVEFRASDLSRIHGYQFTLEFDENALQLEEVEYNVLKQQHISLRRAAQGALTFSWDRKAGEAIPGADEVLFTLVFRANEKVRLREALQVSSKHTRAEAYDRNDRRMEIVLEFVPLHDTAEGFELRQNRPNPFADFTVIGFRLPEAAPVVFSIQDAAGKIVRIVRGEYGAGYNEMRIERDELPAAGVYYYTLKAGSFTATRKMVITE
jgi:uncharacterized repeat protein (TIGR01451 family)